MVADRLGHATFSNEGSSDTWKPEPLKYPTYRDYLREIYFGHYTNPNPKQQERIAAMMEESFRFVPEPLQKIKEP